MGWMEFRQYLRIWCARICVSEQEAGASIMMIMANMRKAENLYQSERGTRVRCELDVGSVAFTLGFAKFIFLQFFQCDAAMNLRETHIRYDCVENWRLCGNGPRPIKAEYSLRLVAKNHWNSEKKNSLAAKMNSYSVGTQQRWQQKTNGNRAQSWFSMEKPMIAFLTRRNSQFGSFFYEFFFESFTVLHLLVCFMSRRKHLTINFSVTHPSDHHRRAHMYLFHLSRFQPMTVCIQLSIHYSLLADNTSISTNSNINRIDATPMCTIFNHKLRKQWF